jgi:uncharacterized membrane protein YccC
MEASHVASSPALETSRKHPRWWRLHERLTWDPQGASLPNSALKSDLEAPLFSLKCFAAATLALYVSFRIGLTRPFWALGTVYLVSQTFSGASVSRGLFRFFGTLVGAAATVFLVPTFVNEPLVLSMVLAAWMGFCLYIARLDRTPRAYAFQLAGYTTSLIGFPYLMNPGGIFTVASIRVQEISIGILCATLIHALILPRRVSYRVQARVASLLADSERWTRHMLGNAQNAVLAKDRARAAVDMLDLHQLSTHLPFDTVDGPVQVQILRALHARLLVVLSLSGAIDDTLAELRASPQGMPVWRDLLIETLAANLADLMLAHQDCRLLEQRLKTARPRWRRNLPERLLDSQNGYVLHRDHWLAARGAIGAAIGITISCALWIGTAWSDGPTAVSLVAAACALFGTADQPVGNLIRYLIGSVAGVVLGLVYGFVILPRTTDFVSLAAVLAPALLVSGLLLAKPLYAFAALGVVLTFPIIAGLGPTNAVDFSSAANSVLALFIGLGMAAVSLHLFQTIGTDQSTRRILRAIRSDIARRLTRGRATGMTRWTSRMVDRIGLLVPRLSGHSQSSHLLRQALADVRTGNAAGELLALEKRLYSREIRSCLVSFLDELAAYFQEREAAGVDDLLARLDAVMAAMAVETSPVRGRVLALLSELRRDLLLRASPH